MLRTAACKLLRSPRRQYKALVPLGSAVAVADSCPLALNLLAWTSQTCQLSKTAYGLQRQQHERQQKSQECQVVQYVRGTDITLSVKGEGKSAKPIAIDDPLAERCMHMPIQLPYVCAA